LAEVEAAAITEAADIMEVVEATTEGVVEIPETDITAAVTVVVTAVEEEEVISFYDYYFLVSNQLVL